MWGGMSSSAYTVAWLEWFLQTWLWLLYCSARDCCILMSNVLLICCLSVALWIIAGLKKLANCRIQRFITKLICIFLTGLYNVIYLTLASLVLAYLHKQNTSANSHLSKDATAASILGFSWLRFYCQQYILYCTVWVLNDMSIGHLEEGLCISRAPD